MQNAPQLVDELYNSRENLDYRSLIRDYGALVRLCLRRFPGTETYEKMQAVRKRAFLVSLKDSGVLDGERDDKKRKDFHYLFRLAGHIYQPNNGRTPWQIALEEAGSVESARSWRGFNLAKILSELNKFSESGEQLSTSNIMGLDGRLVKVANEYLGFGKCVILTGYDYNSLPSIRNHPERVVLNRFSREDLQKIFRDKSLGGYDKVRCIFYALALQNYDFTKYASFSQRRIDPPKRRNHFQYTQYLHTINVSTHDDGDNWRVLLEFYGGIPAKFHGVDFTFRRTDGEHDSFRFKMGIEDLVK